MACCRFRPIGTLLVALPFLFVSSNAFAQSSEAAIANAATARSLADAAAQNEKDLIGREALGQSSGGSAAGVGAFATGRLRTSDHDGLDIQPLVTEPGVFDDGIRKTFSYETDEASVFANIVATLPGTTLGGQLKLSSFVGYNWLSLDLKSNAVSILDPDQFGGAENESVIAGGTVLWALQGTYALATVIGAWGETTLNDSVDDCNPCVFHRYKYNTSGFIGTVTAGHVFAVAGSTGPMLDLRGTVNYTETDSDRFLNINDDGFKLDFSTWTGTGGVTLFSNLSMQGNAILRPYVQAYVRQEWDYDSTLAFTQAGSGAFTLTAYDQSNLYAGVDAGLTYVLDKVTVGGAIYYEASSDEDTVGGRLGASWALN